MRNESHSLSGTHSIGSIDSAPSGTGVSARVGIYLLIALSLILFIGGFLAGEDGFGGAVRDDLYLYHGPTMWAFRDKPFLSVLPDYTSATTPLFQFLESFNPLLGHDTAFRATNTVFSLLTCGLFIFAIRRRYDSIPTAHDSALLIGTSILLSPYFRAESYWVSTDVFPVFLIVVTAILLHPIQDADSHLSSKIRLWLLIPLLAVLSWSAFYCRQTNLFLPFYILLLLLWRFPNYWWWSVLLFGALGMPGVYLVHLWKGLTPPRFRHHQGLSLDAIVPPFSMILIYSVPFLLELAVRKRMRLMDAAGRVGHKWFYWIAGWVSFIAIFHSFKVNKDNEGGGVASRILAHFGQPGHYLFLTISYLGFIILFFLFRGSSWRGRTLIISFFLPAFVMTVFFQRYYDPLLMVIFFLLWERKSVIRFLTVRTGVFLIVFNAVLLVGALIYNGRTERVFFPLTSHSRPWIKLTR